MPEDNRDGWRDVVAMIIATLWVIAPGVIVLAAFYAAVTLVLRLIAH